MTDTIRIENAAALLGVPLAAVRRLHKGGVLHGYHAKGKGRRGPIVLDLSDVELLKARLDAGEKLPRTPRDDREHREQATLFQWAETVTVEYPMLRWLHAVPNGGHRHKAVAAALTAEGLKPGVPDVCLPYPSRGYHGLYLEMKAKGGRVRPDQQPWLNYLESVGYKVNVGWSWIEGAQCILEYLGADEATIRRLTEGLI